MPNFPYFSFHYFKEHDRTMKIACSRVYGPPLKWRSYSKTSHSIKAKSSFEKLFRLWMDRFEDKELKTLGFLTKRQAFFSSPVVTSGLSTVTFRMGKVFTSGRKTDLSSSIVRNVLSNWFYPPF